MLLLVKLMPETGMRRDGTIAKRVYIQARPATVFHALTEAQALMRWFCDRAASDPVEGGELVAYWRTGKSGTKGRAIYRQLVPESLVELLWIDDGSGPDAEGAHHALSYSIQARKDGCEVRVRDRDYPPPDEETYGILEDGWNSVLLELKDYCEQAERSSKARS